MKHRSSRARKPAWHRSLQIALLLVLLAIFNVYFFFLRGGTSIGDLRRIVANHTTVNLPKPKPAAQPLPASIVKENKEREFALPEIEHLEEERLSQGELGAGETLSAMLARENIPPATAAEITTALARVFNPRMVRPQHGYTLRWDGEERLRSFEYRNTLASFYRVERNAAGLWRAQHVTTPLETQVVEVGGEIETSLYDAMRRQGETTALVAQLVDLFAWDINFFIDPQPHDQFRLLVEKQFLDGVFYKYGRILAAEYSGRVGRYRAFWYQATSAAGTPARGGYYNERGESVEKSLLKTPLKYVRISSSFDRRRFHPILHTELAHLGVDYAAPTGTPVWASAGGRITFRGPRGAAGNCVIVAHPGGMESVYMHLARFARGLEAGQRVRQKQVLGYVGASGLASGPHLHFSVKLGGHFIDPLRLKPARAASLPAAQRAIFQNIIAPRIEALAHIDTRKPPREEGSVAAQSM